MGLGPLHLLLAGKEVPLAHGSEDLELGVKSVDAGFEAYLVVALAGAAVGDVGGAGLMRDVNELAHDQRTRECREQRVAVLVEAIGRDGLGQKLLGILLTHVERLGIDGAHVIGLLLDPGEVLCVLADVSTDGHHVEALLELQPLDHDRGVEATGVCKYDLLLGVAMYVFIYVCHDVLPS